MIYYAIDGDDVGRRLEFLVVSNKIEEVRLFSEDVNNALTRIKRFLIDHDCEIIFAAGDSILATSAKQVTLKNVPLIQGQISFSMGVGKSSDQALLALKKAKALGKSRYEVVSEISFQ